MTKKNNVIFFGLLGIAITSSIIQSVSSLEKSIYSVEKIIKKSFKNNKFHMRFYSYSNDWNKGFVPQITKENKLFIPNNYSIEKFEDKITASNNDWNKGFVPKSKIDSAIESIDQQSTLSSRKWHFNPTRSLFYYRDYYNPTELEERKRQSVLQKTPIKEDDSMVEFSLEKKK